MITKKYTHEREKKYVNENYTKIEKELSNEKVKSGKLSDNYAKKIYYTFILIYKQ